MLKQINLWPNCIVFFYEKWKDKKQIRILIYIIFSWNGIAVILLFLALNTNQSMINQIGKKGQILIYTLTSNGVDIWMKQIVCKTQMSSINV